MTVADSSLLLLDCGKLDCLEEGKEAKRKVMLLVPTTERVMGRNSDREEGRTADSSGGRVFTRLPVEDNKLLQRHPSVSKKERIHIHEFLHSV